MCLLINRCSTVIRKRLIFHKLTCGGVVYTSTSVMKILYTHISVDSIDTFSLVKFAYCSYKSIKTSAWNISASLGSQRTKAQSLWSIVPPLLFSPFLVIWLYSGTLDYAAVVKHQSVTTDLRTLATPSTCSSLLAILPDATTVPNFVYQLARRCFPTSKTGLKQSSRFCEFIRENIPRCAIDVRDTSEMECLETGRRRNPVATAIYGIVVEPTWSWNNGRTTGKTF